jgi:hypothetical protein
MLLAALAGRAFLVSVADNAFPAEGGRFDLGWWSTVGRQIRGPVPITSLIPGDTGANRCRPGDGRCG